ncbi:transketolase family protein [Streptomyces silvisoli]|uniref:Transketolase C-terminal domain-containing protein n=1 Tax=Streptomyces silvisoli TaxID=3034235 RepID=A0ABT5ZMS0_9ACTN|nr:transketolase C-terminal domain-containing protein [Streptomyces silvisoli]MDF3290303.1 transketolase C-terminal domain-containing protein [Streptomyces silvisoli]
MNNPVPPHSAGALIGSFLRTCAEESGDVYFIKADGTLPGADSFVDDYPQFYLNAGIAEQNAMSIAGGMALTGKTVYLWNTCTFLVFRPYDQIRWDAAYRNAKIRLIGTSSGYTRGPMGMAGITVEDIGALRSMPNMTIVCPGDRHEMASLLQQCHTVDGPVFMRLGVEREEMPALHESGRDIVLGRASVVCEGDQAVLLATGHLLPEAWELVQKLREEGLRMRLVSMHTIKPFDYSAVQEMAAQGLPILTYEDHNIIGGLGSAAAEAIAESGHGVPFRRIGIPDRYTTRQGDVFYQRREVGFSDLDEIRSWLKKHMT